MAKKIKCIVKRPDEEYGHVCNISNTLKNLQTTVGGHIEAITLNNVVIICNEEGKIMNLPHNFSITHKRLVGMTYSMKIDNIVGTVIVCGIDGDNFGDVPISFAEWKEILKEWGN